MRRMGALLVAFTLLGAACGDDDDLGSDDTTADTEAVEPASTEPVITDAEPVATDAEPVVTDAEPVADPSAGDGGADSEGPIPTGDAGSAWCGVADEVQMAFDGLDAIDLNDPTVLEPAYRRVREMMGDAQAFVPPELEDALAVNMMGIDILIDELDAVGWRFIDLDLSAMADIEQELGTSGQAIERYNFYVCGIDNGYDPDSIPDDGDDESLFEGDGTIRDLIIAELVGFGFTPEQAACVADRVDFTNFDPVTAQPIFVECGVSAELMAQFFG